MDLLSIAKNLPASEPEAGVLRSLWIHRQRSAVSEALDRLEAIRSIDAQAARIVRETFDTATPRSAGFALSSPACLWGLRADDLHISLRELAYAAADCSHTVSSDLLHVLHEVSTVGTHRVLPNSGRVCVHGDGTSVGEYELWARAAGWDASMYAGDWLFQSKLVDPHPQVTDVNDFRQFVSCFESAREELESSSPGLSKAANGLLRAVVPMCRPGRGVPSASSNLLPGAIWITDHEDPVILAEQVTHECSHALLFLLQEHDSLIDAERHGDGWGEPLVYSPWRDDPRPVAGLFHGAVVFMRVSLFHLRRVEKCRTSRGRLTALIPQLRIALEMLSELSYTDSGQVLLKELRRSFDLLDSIEKQLSECEPVYLECSSVANLVGTASQRQAAHKNGKSGRVRTGIGGIP